MLQQEVQRQIPLNYLGILFINVRKSLFFSIQMKKKMITINQDFFISNQTDKR